MISKKKKLPSLMRYRETGKIVHILGKYARNVSCRVLICMTVFLLSVKRGNGAVEFKSDIMDEAAVDRALTRISHEIIERNEGADGVCIVGIMRRGVSLAEIISGKLRNLGIHVQTGSLDVSLYRDDLSEYDRMPTVKKPDIGFDIAGKTVIMVDDVIYTGRTARAAMDALISCGRPSKIQLAVLCDRGHRELPIRPDYVGKNVPTSKNEIVVVSVPPYDEGTNVKLYKK